MKSLKIIAGITLITATILGTAQAGNMTTQEVFNILEAGDLNSIEKIETVELSKMEFSDIISETSYSPAINVLDVINSD